MHVPARKLSDLFVQACTLAREAAPPNARPIRSHSVLPGCRGHTRQASDLAGVGQKARRNGQYTQKAVNGVGTGGSLVGGLKQGVGAAGMSCAGGMGKGGGK